MAANTKRDRSENDSRACAIHETAALMISRFRNDLKKLYRGHWLQTNEVLKLHTYI